MPSKLNIKLIILGAPGSGKGTISNRILKDFPSLEYFSVGDCLRDHMKKTTSLGQEARHYIQQGKLVPDSTINKLVISELSSSNFVSKSWLLDGYPRNKSQALELWSHQQLRPQAAINLIVPDDEIIERVKHRWLHLTSGRIYHNIYSPPKKPGYDDVTGEALTQREDDKPEVVKARLEEFHERNNEIAQFFKERKILANFEGRESNIIYPKVKAFLDSLFK